MPKRTVSLVTSYSLSFLLLMSLLGCGDYESTISDEDRQTFTEFVAADVTAVDEEGFAGLVELCKKLITGTGASSMSGAETDQVTAQIETMISRLEGEIAGESNPSKKKTKGRQLYELKRSIGRGGA